MKKFLGADGALRFQDKHSADPKGGRITSTPFPSSKVQGASPRASLGPFPLSFAQEQLWYLDQLEPGSPVYNISQGLHLRGPLDREALQKSLNWIIARHESLRTNFAMHNGAPAVVVTAHRHVELGFTDLGNVTTENRAEVVQFLTQEEARRPFDLSHDSLIRLVLLRLGPDEHILVVTVHHIVFDGWSLGIFYRELAEAYRAYLEARVPRVNDLPIQYSDYAAWERQHLQGETLEVLHSYWKKALSEPGDTHHLIPDHRRPPRQTYSGATEAAVVPADIASSLLRMGTQHSATLFMTLMAALQTMLYRYSGHEDISVGFPIAHRTRAEVTNLIGFFVNTLVLRCHYSGNPTFSSVLRQVRNASLGAFLHQDLPFENLVALLRPDRTLRQHPLFQSMLVLKNTPLPKAQWPGLEATTFDIDLGTAKLDLTVIVDLKPDLKITFEYNRDLFDASTVRRWITHYSALLAGAARNPDTPISDLPLLTPQERVQLLEEWNNTALPIPQAPVNELFERNAEALLDSVALVLEKDNLSYRELNQQANALAAHLRATGIKADARVGICVRRSFDWVVGMLAILKAGATYVPLDPDYPHDRLEFIIADAEIHVVLTQTSCADSLPRAPIEILYLDRFPYAGGPSQNVPTETKPDDVAVVLYTSGSTGKPKGVELTHKCFRGLAFGQDVLRIDPTDVVLHRSSIAFDLSILEVWGTLLNGARCVLFAPNAPTASDLQEAITTHHVTTLWLTSTLFNAVIDEAPEALAAARRVLIGGEALSVPHICRALKALPGLQLVNGYGPTETTALSTAYRIPAHTPPDATSIPIGRPITNEKVYVLDRRMQPVPIGVPGEIYIGGHGVGRGYVNRPELTARKFLPNPFTKEPSERIYKTGDWGRWLPTGVLEFITRLDDQVKIRGYRVELGEIEAALTAYPQAKAAVVVVREDPSTGKRLVAYVVLRQGAERNADALQSFLKDKLPDYMVPSDFVFLDVLPTSRNGKIDRLALPAPDETKSRSTQEYVAPRNQVESRLVEIWEGLLDRRPISVRANFYDLGGHSLLAVRLVAAIERTLGRKLRLSMLVSNPTIEKLAASLKDNGVSGASALVAIQEHGSKPPLFCVHGGGGEVLRFVPLARQMGSDQPFYGMRSPEVNGDSEPISVESLAKRYVREVQSAHPGGPFYLAGASFGGLVAFEMARLLQEQGSEVALLALFDTCNPDLLRAHTFGQFLKYQGWKFEARFKEHWNQFWHAKAGEKKQALLHTLRSVKTRLDYAIWRTSCQYFSLRHRPIPVRLRDNVRLFTAAALRFRPKPYAGRITLFKAQVAEMGPDPELGWGVVAQGGVEVYEVPGDHMTILDQPRVAEVARRLRLCIDGAPTVSSRPRWIHHPHRRFVYDPACR